MNLIKELLQLNEAKKTYQVRFNDYRTWNDVELDIRDLETLAKEIANDPNDKEMETHKFQDVASLYHYILDFYGAAEDYQKKNADIFDVVDEDLEIKSFKDDVLVVNYQFTIRYGRTIQDVNKANKARAEMNKKSSRWSNESHGIKDNKIVKGSITLMPGN